MLIWSGVSVNSAHASGSRTHHAPAREVHHSTSFKPVIRLRKFRSHGPATRQFPRPPSFCDHRSMRWSICCRVCRLEHSYCPKHKAETQERRAVIPALRRQFITSIPLFLTTEWHPPKNAYRWRELASRSRVPLAPAVRWLEAVMNLARVVWPSWGA